LQRTGKVDKIAASYRHPIRVQLRLEHPHGGVEGSNFGRHFDVSNSICLKLVLSMKDEGSSYVSVPSAIGATVNLHLLAPMLRLGLGVESSAVSQSHVTVSVSASNGAGTAFANSFASLSQFEKTEKAKRRGQERWRGHTLLVKPNRDPQENKVSTSS
jgi:hypothetical protein